MYECMHEPTITHHHVKLLGVSDELHGSIVDVHVRELHVRVVLVLLNHNVPPELLCCCPGQYNVL